jgi:peptidyl-prolyl cis-trans isomerase B (cyclophilin B)
MKKNLFIIIFLFTFISGNLFSQTFTGKPRYQISTKRNGIALGTFTVELWPNIAPLHVRNFDSLVNISFYDTTAFHRVVPGFVIQGGDPNSRSGPVSTWGQGQPGQTTVPAEFTVARHVRGVLSAARLASNINSATSQFFICVATAANLNGNYSAYGRVTSGMTVVDTIVSQPTVGTTQRPVQKIEMFITNIGSNDTVPKPPVLLAPANNTVGLDSNVAFQLKWNPVSDAIFYHIDVSTDSMFVMDTVVRLDLTNTILVLNNLKGNTRYYWRVIANNGGHSTSSQRWNFHTSGETTGIKTIKQNADFSIYPNPNNGLFKIENAYGKRIEITDITGKKIFETIADSNEIEIDLKRKCKGIYFYHVQEDGKSTLKGKLIIQ